MSKTQLAKSSRRVVRAHAARGPNKPKQITEDRKLISRKEAAAILGCCADTVKKLEKQRGGPLEAVRLHPNARSVFYRLADVHRVFGLDEQPV